MKELTKAEEQVMQVVWRLQSCFIKEILEELPEPKPAYNTVGTFIKLLEGKGFLERKKVGNVYAYSPLINERDYSRKSIKTLMGKFFNGSSQDMLSFLVEEQELTLDQIEDLMKKLKKND